jgi:Tfp pilus assembly protein FimT
VRIQRPGATLIELVIVVIIVSILTGITLLRAGQFLDSIAVRGAVTEIQSLFSLARHVAISRGAQSTLLIDESAGAITIRSGSEIVRTREVGTAHRVTLSTNRNSIIYSPIGVGYGAANFSLVVSRGAVADTIVVSRLGRVRH